MVISPNLTNDERNRRLEQIKQLAVNLLKKTQKKPAEAGKKEIV